MMENEESARPAVRRMDGVLLGMVLALAAASLASYFGLDRQAVSLLTRTPVNWGTNVWVDVFARLGKAWLQIWLLLIWFRISRRRRDVLAALLALVIVAILVNPLKVTVGRPRPYAASKAEAAGESEYPFAHRLSFPSGDTAVVFAVTTAVLPAVGWPLRVLLLGSSTAIGCLRVADLAHYPSDILAGAAIGIFAGWLATRLVTKWEMWRHPVPFEEWFVPAGLVGIPIFVGVSEGPADTLRVLMIYGLLVLGIVSVVRIRELLRGTGSERVLAFLAKTRVAAVCLTFIVIVVANVLTGEKPHEFLPLDKPISPMAVIGFVLVFAGAAMRFWAKDQGPRTDSLAEGPYAVVRHPVHLASFLVVCGLLLQLRGGMNWLVLLPVFVLFYGASLLREEEVQGKVFGEAWRSYKTDVPAVIPSLRRLLTLHVRGLWSRKALATRADVWTTLVLICLPVLIELFLEDFLFEHVLGT
jgi:membrane-associated phospholipid phosphatase/protein-S-isoprenylcysteine O-methyltransferase Ste14